MGNTSLHSRLAQALAKAGSYVPEALRKLNPTPESKELLHLKGLLDGVSTVRHGDSSRRK